MSVRSVRREPVAGRVPSDKSLYAGLNTGWWSVFRKERGGGELRRVLRGSRKALWFGRVKTDSKTKVVRE